MQSKTLKTFLADHPKLFELAFAGTAAAGTITVELSQVTTNPGP